MPIGERLNARVFRFVHERNLVYNTCWEDPRLDRVALQLRPHDTVLVITSAGCNALDYALAEPQSVIAVDMNPRQNALLELKLAAVRGLEYEEFFSMFGLGRLDRAGKIYADKLRFQLSPWSRDYWDRWIEFFEPGNMRSFYFRGTCGLFAMMMNFYANSVLRMGDNLDRMLNATSIEEQKRIYEYIHDRFWNRSMRFVMKRDSVLALLGVPKAQRRQVESEYEGGIYQFAHDCAEAVFCRLPLADNYFWQVYLKGRYSRKCCPEYLKPHNFQRLKSGLVDRIEVHTDTIQGFLEKNNRQISRFVLLDHMDWLIGHRDMLLEKEWEWMVRRAIPGTKLIWRSGGLHTDFVDILQIDVDGRKRFVGELLTYNRPLAQQLHQQCRVHTYGSFHIADLAT